MPDSRIDPLLLRDTGHTLVVALLAMLLTFGLPLLWCLWRVLHEARRSHLPDGDGWLLVFGKRLQAGRPDADYQRRLDAALAHARTLPHAPLLLLGGGPAGCSEAEVGLRTLQAMGLPDEVPVQLECQSLDTLQNLRNARALLAGAAASAAPLQLLSNRYHLARCASFARLLGLSFRVCAAEPVFRLREQRPGRLLVEAAYLWWLHCGVWWARLLGHRRLLARIS